MNGFSVRLLFSSQRESHSVPNLNFGTLSYGESYKIIVLCLSVHQEFGIFIRNSLLLFSDFLFHDRQSEYLKIDRAIFPRKIHFPQILAKIAQNGSKIGLFGFFEKFCH